MRIAILEYFNQAQNDFVSSVDITPHFSSSPNPIREVLLENAEVGLMPLQECPITLPAGISITALTERKNVTYSILLKKDKQELGQVLDIPAHIKMIVPTALLQQRLAAFFPDATLIINPQLMHTWHEEDIEAIVMPSCYLDFINTTPFIIHELHPSEFVPQSGQGTFAFITRTDDISTRRLLKKIHHSDTVRFTNIERKMQRQWENQGIVGTAFCEKDAMNFYHLYTQILDENMTILTEKKSSSTLSSWF
jgi:hypothetical protein